jgi:hypothetical protein
MMPHFHHDLLLQIYLHDHFLQ